MTSKSGWLVLIAGAGFVGATGLASCFFDPGTLRLVDAGSDASFDSGGSSSSSSGDSGTSSGNPNAVGRLDSTFGQGGVSAGLAPASLSFTPTSGVVLPDDRILVAGYGANATGVTDTVVGVFTPTGQAATGDAGGAASIKYTRASGAPAGQISGVLQFPLPQGAATPVPQLVFFGTAPQASPAGYAEYRDLPSATTCTKFYDPAVNRYCTTVPNGTSTGQHPSTFTAAAATTNGAVYLAGPGPDATVKDFMVTRLSGPAMGTGVGDTDYTWAVSDNYMARVDLGGDETVSLLSVQSDGKLLVVGTTTAAGKAGVAMVRYGTSGALDASFGPPGAGGKAYTSTPADKLVLADAGKIIGAFKDGTGAATKTTFARFNTDGTLDTTFGNGGRASAAWPANSGTSIAAVVYDGGFIYVGYADFTVGRFSAAGALDAAWGSTRPGFTTVPAEKLGGGGAVLTALGKQSMSAGGAIVAMGGQPKSNGDAKNMYCARFATAAAQ